MKKLLEEKLIKIVKSRQTKDDPSHDFNHILRVFNLAVKIGKKENADLDIIIPAALFHDIIIYPKNTLASKNESDESAKFAADILDNFKDYPKDKIEKVSICVSQCSFSKGIRPDLLEAKILQDADGLESTGAISIMRTSSSGGKMNRQFYYPIDPFCKNGAVAGRSNLDLFYTRLLIVEKRMHTKLAKQFARRRSIFIRRFLHELKLELEESKLTC